LPAEADEVREALECLYEDVALARAPLAGRFADVAAAQPIEIRAQELRRRLLHAIERLRPARPVAFGDRAARSYQVLSLRYLEEMNMKQIADELGVGDRQAYRELRRAEAELATVLGSFTGAATPAQERVGDSLDQEMEHLVARPHKLDLSQLLRGVASALAPLCEHSGVRLAIRADEPLPVLADEGLLKQLLIQSLSLAIQSADAGELSLRAAGQSGSANLSLSYVPAREQPGVLVDSVRRLAEAQHIRLETGQTQGGATMLTVSLPAVEPRLMLVVEDNEAAIELYRRYVADSPQWQVVGAPDPRVGLDMALRLRPAVIVLDIMMPQQDGWSVLQTFRTRPETASTPVLICSVFYDPGLAAALGATAYLKKPITRAQFLAALEALPS